jgi:hypothetical protein
MSHQPQLEFLVVPVEGAGGLAFYEFGRNYLMQSSGLAICTTYNLKRGLEG